MIQLLFPFILSEMALIVLFVFKTPLRKLVIMALDRVKRGRGPIVVKTVGGTIFVVMMATVYNAVAIQRRWIEDAEVNPTDQVLFAKHLLEASLMGFLLFLALMIDRLHHYIRELHIRRKSTEGMKKQNRVFEDGKPPVSEEIKVSEQETTSWRERIKALEAQLEEKTKEASIAVASAQALKKQSEGFLLEYKQLKTQLEGKTKEANSAEANARALEKQSEGLLLEYDRLLEENQNLRSQLQSLDRKFSFSESKKVM